MKLRHPRLCSVMSWTIAIALSLSPVMAQNTADPGSSAAVQQSENSPAVAKESANPTVDISVLPELPLASTATAFPDVTRNSTPAAAPLPTQPAPSSDAPGQSKWVILAALIIAGAVVGTILLIRGLGGGGDKKPPAQTGTIITAGPPSVSVPSH